MEAVTGPMTGKNLAISPSLTTTWARWRKEHPNTLVLSKDTGFKQDYESDPYLMYVWGDIGMPPPFPVDYDIKVDLLPKEKVLGLTIKGISKAYPFSELEKVSLPLKDTIGGEKVMIFFDKKSQTAYVKDDKGKVIPSVVGFWFAWSAFHPKTLVYKTR